MGRYEDPAQALNALKEAFDRLTAQFENFSALTAERLDCLEDHVEALMQKDGGPDCHLTGKALREALSSDEPVRTAECREDEVERFPLFTGPETSFEGPVH